MKLSIIIPNFNTQKLLESCLVSVIEQTKNISFEIIVVDNASSYNIKNQIARIRRAYPKENIKLIQNKKNLGYSRANNQGIKESKGDDILFLNSDTLILDKAIEKAVNLMENDKKIDIIGCKLLNKNGTIQPSAGFFPRLRQIFYMMFFLDDLPGLSLVLKPYHQQNTVFYQKKREIDWVTGAFLLVRKKVIEAIGGFDEDYFMYAEEIDFCYRAKKADFKIIYEPGINIIHHKEASSKIAGLSGRALLAELSGLKIFFTKHKPAWEMPILLFLIKMGTFLRLIIFGILLGNAEKRNIYWRALFLA